MRPSLGQIVFSALNQMFIEFVKDEAMPLARLHALSAAQTASLGRADGEGRGKRPLTRFLITFSLAQS